MFGFNYLHHFTQISHGLFTIGLAAHMLHNQHSWKWSTLIELSLSLPMSSTGTQLTTRECSPRCLSNYTSHSHITLLQKKVTSWVGMMFTLQSFILSGFEKPLPLYLLARGKSLLKILWNQAARWRNPSLQINFACYTFIFLVCTTIILF